MHGSADRAATISLLVGVPVTEQELVARLTAPGAAPSDYLARFDAPDRPPAQRIAHLRERWLARYGPAVGEPLSKLIEAAELLGCRVRRAAGLADLAAARDGDVIIVLAHWKGSEFGNDDFAPGFAAEAEARLAAIDAPLADWIRARLQPRRRLGLFPTAPMTMREAMRAALAAKLREFPQADRLEELASTTAARRRDQLDLWLAGCLRPGNRLELFDGLHDCASVCAALEDFEGVVDLTVCTSTWLGDRISAHSRQKTRTVQFVEVQEPARAALKVLAVLRLVASGEAPYLHARLIVQDSFPDLVRQVREERRRERA